MNHKVDVRLEKRNIPTYEPGKPEINPVFFEKRVYQGSSGKVYPVPFIDKIYDHKTDKIYDATTSTETSVLLTGTNEPTDF